MEDRLRKVESEIAVLKRDCEDVKSDMSEIRRFQSTVNTFMDTFNATQKQMERAQEARHLENQNKIDHQTLKLNFIGVCVAIATAVILVATAYIAYQASRRNALLTTAPVVTAEYQAR